MQTTLYFIFLETCFIEDSIVRQKVNGGTGLPCLTSVSYTHLLDPERRLLKLVEIEDARMASEMTELLMGTDVPPRKAFIYDHATDAELDI